MKRIITGHAQDGTSIFSTIGEPPCGITYEMART
jgi:hypothetical protein